MLPQLAEGDANKVFVVPSEFASAFGGIGEALTRGAAPGIRPRRPHLREAKPRREPGGVATPRRDRPAPSGAPGAARIS